MNIKDAVSNYVAVEEQSSTHESHEWAARDAAWAAWDASWDASKWEAPRSTSQDAEWFAARRAAKAARSAAWSQAYVAQDMLRK